MEADFFPLNPASASSNIERKNIHGDLFLATILEDIPSLSLTYMASIALTESSFVRLLTIPKLEIVSQIILLTLESKFFFKRMLLWTISEFVKESQHNANPPEKCSSL